VGETVLFGNGQTRGFVTCTLCSSKTFYHQVVRGIVLCNPCAADFRPIPRAQKREWKRREYADRS
jgi:hypothetical protein